MKLEPRGRRGIAKRIYEICSIVNAMVASEMKPNNIFCRKLKNSTILLINTKRPVFFKTSGEFVSIQSWIKWILPKKFFLFFCRFLYPFRQSFVFSLKFRGIVNPHDGMGEIILGPLKTSVTSLCPDEVLFGIPPNPQPIYLPSTTEEAYEKTHFL